MKHKPLNYNAIKKIFIIFSIIIIFITYLSACKALTNEKSGQKNTFIHNGNDPSANHLEISLIALTNAQEVLKIALHLNVQIRDLKNNKFYLAKSPQQRTGGYEFIAKKDNGQVFICLKKPQDTDSVLMAFSNPFALIESEQDLEVSIGINYCNNN